MDAAVLKQQIKDKKLNDFYIFTGDEWAGQKLFINKMAECNNLQIKYIDSIKDIYSTLVNPGFLVTNYCYVVRDDKDILTEDKIQQQILHGLLKKNILILLLTQIDRRSKGFKVFEDKYINFDKMSLETLKKYVKREINLSDSNSELLINICERDYGRILLEIDKIKKYKEYLNNDAYEHDLDNSMPAIYSDSVFEKLLKDGTIYIPPEDAVFDLVDAILKREFKRTFELLQDCYDIGEANLVILGNLYNATKQLLQVQSCDKGVDIMETCGITYPQWQAAKSRLNRYSIGELVHLLKLIREVEKGIKIGLIEDQISIEYIIINVM